MPVTIQDQPELRVGAVRHIGAYHDIGRAFQRLGSLVNAGGHHAPAASQFVAIFHDDPRTTAVDHLRSDAAMTFPEGVEVPPGLIERRLPAGRYATAMHAGSYEGLGAAWSRLRQGVQEDGYQPGAGASYEIYLNDPSRTPKEELRTELFMPIS